MNGMDLAEIVLDSLAHTVCAFCGEKSTWTFSEIDATTDRRVFCCVGCTAFYYRSAGNYFISKSESDRLLRYAAYKGWLSTPREATDWWLKHDPSQVQHMMSGDWTFRKKWLL